MMPEWWTKLSHIKQVLICLVHHIYQLTCFANKGSPLEFLSSCCADITPKHNVVQSSACHTHQQEMFPKKKSGNCWITHPNRETVLPVPLEGLYQHFFTYMRMHTGVIIQGAENVLQLAEVLDYHVATVLQYKGYSVALRGLNRPQSYTHLLSAPLPYLEF